MASIFRPTYTKADPKTGKRCKRKAEKWYVQYCDSDGIVRRVKGYTDKEATRQYGAKLERQAARGEQGMVDAFEEQRKRPLAEHIEDYRRYLTNKGDTAEHAQVTSRRILRICEACKFARIADIAVSKFADWLAGLRQSDEISIQTSNYYVRAAKGFCCWLVRDRRTDHNPLQHLQGLNAQTDRRIERRALSDGDFWTLIQAAGIGQPFRDLTATDRKMLYLAAAYSGLRASELRSLTPASFDLDGEHPSVTVAAAYSKRRRTDTQAIRADLAGELREWLKDKPADAPVWPGTWHKVAAKMLRKDLAAAKLPFADESGRVFDFHAFRHQYVSNLVAAGIHPKTAQLLARHSTIALTMERYTHVNVVDVAAAVERLPGIPSGQSEASQKATGTDGRLALKLALPLARTTDAALHATASGGSGDSETAERKANAGSTFGVIRHPNSSGAKVVRAGIEPATHGFSADFCV